MHVSELFDPRALRREVKAGYVYETAHPEGLPLRIFSYAPPVLYEERWTPVTRRCRGLVLDSTDTVVALPFERFFNLGDPAGPPVPEGESFRVFEKLDGSLGIVFEYDGRWHTATRGSFTSTQARKGAELLKGRTDALRPDLTYLFEIIYPEGRIVVAYEGERLSLLTAFSRETGDEHLGERERLSKDALGEGGFDVAGEHEPSTLGALKTEDRAGREGYVVRFAGGQRFKIKHPTYVELHRLASSAGPRWVWERLCARDLAARGLAPKEIEAKAGLARRTAERILSGEPPLDELTERLPHPRLQEEVRAARTKLREAFDQQQAQALREARRLSVGDPRASDEDRKQTALRFQETEAETGLLFRAVLGGTDALAPLVWKRLRPSGKGNAFEHGF